MNNNCVFVTGIGTEVGKTVVSAILCEAHKCTYWKPIQAGDLDHSDSMKISEWCPDVSVLPERFKFNKAASPHLAAQTDSIEISENQLQLPDRKQNTLIEGAGGLLVPLNNNGLLYADVIKNWKIPLVLVSRHYLGSINHTLLTLEYLKKRQIPVLMLIWVGDENPASESIVQQLFPTVKTHRIPENNEIDTAFIRQEAERFPVNLFETIPVIL